MNLSILSLIALLSGGGIAWIIYSSGVLATYMDPFNSSLWVHAIGAFFATLIIPFLAPKAKKTLKAPLWAYGAGTLGASIVVISSVTSNSVIGLSGTISCVLLGQLVFGQAADHFGWFGLRKRKISVIRIYQLGLVLTGSGIIIFLS